MSGIPKVIHYFWLGGGEPPERDKRCIESWSRVCPDYEIVRWDESNYDISKNRYMAQAYEARKWGFVPDFGRLDVIHTYGGVYLDTDVELVRPLDDLLAYKGFMGISRNGFVNPGLGFAAEARNPVILHMLRAYDDLEFVHEDGSLNLTASPHYASASLRELGFTLDGGLENIDGFAILPAEYCDPLDEGTGKVHRVENTHSIHWYFGSWLDPQVKMQKELRRSLNAHHVPDAVAFPLSRGVAYVKHHGLVDIIGRIIRGPQVDGGECQR